MVTTDIVLVNPPMAKKEIYGVLASGGTYLPPLGLANLAAVIRSHGYSVKILDASALNLTLQQTIENIILYHAKYVGITAMTFSIDRATILAETLKAQKPNLKVIIGGSHVTALPKETLSKFSCFDIGVIGEGELTIIELLEALEANMPVNNIKGLVFKENSNVKISEARDFIENLDTLPFPAWDLLPNINKFYKPSCFGSMKLPITMVHTIRGCPKRCAFCPRTDFSKSWRMYSPAYVLDMIKLLQRDYGIKDLFFSSADLAISKSWLSNLCKLIIRERLNLVWSCNCRIDSVTPEILSLMKRAGCWLIGYGIESGSQRILDFMQKDIILEKVPQVLKWTKKEGILAKGNFIIGYLTESIESMQATLNFALNNDLDLIRINYFTPLPGSLDYTRAEQYGSFDNDHRKFNCCNIVFIPQGLDKENIRFYSQYITRKFYLRPKIIFCYVKMFFNIKNFKLMLFGLWAFVRFVFFSQKKS